MRWLLLSESEGNEGVKERGRERERERGETEETLEMQIARESQLEQLEIGIGGPVAETGEGGGVQCGLPRCPRAPLLASTSL